MFLKFGALVILTLCFLVSQSAQQCAPQGVVNLRITADYQLTWDIREGETCETYLFLLTFFHPDQPAEYVFYTLDHFYNLDFLEICEGWVIAVVPITKNFTFGEERRTVGYLPMPADADLTLTEVKMNYTSETGLTHIYWSLNETKYRNCPLQYRVTIKETGDPVMEDIYVTNTSLDLRYLSPCASYQFNVRAINDAAFPSIEGPVQTATHQIPGRAQIPPIVDYVEEGTTAVKMTFKLESWLRNPCKVKSLYIDGGSAISENIDISDYDGVSVIPVTLSDLEPDTSYPLRIYVDNSAGWSNATEVTIHTRKEVEPDLNLTEKKTE